MAHGKRNRRGRRPRTHREELEYGRTYGRAQDAGAWHACGSKRRYASKKEAKQAVNESRKAHSRPFYAYRCPKCGGYHLTTKGDQGRRVALDGGRGWATDGKRELRGGGKEGNRHGR